MELNRATIMRLGLPAILAVTVFLPWWRYSFGPFSVSISLWDVVTDPFAPGAFDVLTISLPAIALTVGAVAAAVLGYKEHERAADVRLAAGGLALYLYLRFILESADSIVAFGALLAALIGAVLVAERVKPELLDKIPFPGERSAE